MKALESDPKSDKAWFGWFNLGNIGGGTVDGKRYTEDQWAPANGRLPT